jgi:hypothetical protein
VKMTFARVGGLSPVTYKLPKGASPNFHFPPPRKKGIYAFIYPYMETFLWGWSDENHRDFKQHGYRLFSYKGFLWCHFVKEGLKYAIDSNENWVQIHTDDLQVILKKVIKNDIHFLQQDEWLRGPLYYKIDDPYKRGRGGFSSKDHLEVFIEGKDLGKIK